MFVFPRSRSYPRVRPVLFRVEFMRNFVEVCSEPYPTRDACASSLIQAWGTPLTDSPRLAPTDHSPDRPTCQRHGRRYPPAGCYLRSRSPLDRRILLQDIFAHDDGAPGPGGCWFSYQSARIPWKHDPLAQGFSSLSYSCSSLIISAALPCSSNLEHGSRGLHTPRRLSELHQNLPMPRSRSDSTRLLTTLAHGNTNSALVFSGSFSFSVLRDTIIRCCPRRVQVCANLETNRALLETESAKEVLLR